MGEDGGVKDVGQYPMSPHPGAAPLRCSRHIHPVKATNQRYQKQPGPHPGQTDSDTWADMDHDGNGGGQTDVSVRPDIYPSAPELRPLRLQGPVGPGQKHQQSGYEAGDGSHQTNAADWAMLTASQWGIDGQSHPIGCRVSRYGRRTLAARVAACPIRRQRAFRSTDPKPQDRLQA